MKKSTSFMALAGVAALVLAGCADDAADETTDSTEDTVETTDSEDTDTDTDTEDTDTEDTDTEDTDGEGTEDGDDAGRDYASIDASEYTACIVSDAGGWDDKSSTSRHSTASWMLRSSWVSRRRPPSRRPTLTSLRT